MGAHYAQVMGQFDHVHILPCWHHAFTKDSTLIDFDHREMMCLLAFGNLKNVEVDSSESSLKTQYTIDLMEYMAGSYPKNDLYLIIGSDNLQVMRSWHRWQDLGTLVNFFVMPRPGSSELPFSLPEISSTDIRDALKQGDVGTATSMVPPKVLEYILKNGLYGLPHSTTE